jgi:hypothetical protein
MGGIKWKFKGNCQVTSKRIAWKIEKKCVYLYTG